MVSAKVQVILGAMAKSCMTPQEIADKAGVSVVYRMRRGYMVKLARFGRVCKALEIDPDTVIDYDRLDGKAAGE